MQMYTQRTQCSTIVFPGSAGASVKSPAHASESSVSPPSSVPPILFRASCVKAQPDSAAHRSFPPPPSVPEPSRKPAPKRASPRAQRRLDQVPRRARVGVHRRLGLGRGREHEHRHRHAQAARVGCHACVVVGVGRLGSERARERRLRGGQRTRGRVTGLEPDAPSMPANLRIYLSFPPLSFSLRCFFFRVAGPRCGIFIVVCLLWIRAALLTCLRPPVGLGSDVCCTAPCSICL